MKHINKYDRIEEAICKLEKIICDELNIDLGHMVLKPLDSFHPKSLRDTVEDYQYNEGSIISMQEYNEQFKEV